MMQGLHAVLNALCHARCEIMSIMWNVCYVPKNVYKSATNAI